jgi:hypothetical protein
VVVQLDLISLICFEKFEDLNEQEKEFKVELKFLWSKQRRNITIVRSLDTLPPDLILASKKTLNQKVSIEEHHYIFEIQEE